jgi:plasmid maintenance system antidote protein VapI
VKIVGTRRYSYGMFTDKRHEDAVRMGATIRALRLAYGWKLGNFASCVGVAYSHLSNIEAGRKRCTPQLARRVAEVLGVPVMAIANLDAGSGAA